MFDFRILGIAAGILIIAFFVWLFLKRFKRKKSQILEEGLGGAVSRFRSFEKRASFMDEIEVVINNSEKLRKILDDNYEKGALYMRILSDKELVSKLRETKDKKQIEEYLLTWLKKNYPLVAKSKEEKSEESRHKIKRKKSETLVKTKKAELKKVIEKDKPQTTTAQKSEPPEKLSKQDESVFEEVKDIIDSKNIEKLIEIINSLKEDQLENLVNFYRGHLTEDKTGILFEKSKNSADVITLLRNEAVSGLKEEYERVKSLIVQARKKGKDVQAEWLDLMSIPSKVKMFAATFDKKDFYRIRDSLNKIEKNISAKMQEQKKEDEKPTEKEDNKSRS
jgi:hypothetical protein